VAKLSAKKKAAPVGKILFMASPLRAIHVCVFACLSPLTGCYFRSASGDPLCRDALQRIEERN
jgi:aldehyde:ferredoxin oxidoreductase